MKTTLPQTFFVYTLNNGAVILFPILFVFRPLFKNKGLYVLAPKTLRFCLKFTLWLNCCFAQSCIRLETFPIKLKHPRGLWDQDYKTDQNFTKTSILNWLKDYIKSIFDTLRARVYISGTNVKKINIGCFYQKKYVFNYFCVFHL